jgi:hypothetical protein
VKDKKRSGKKSNKKFPRLKKGNLAKFGYNTRETKEQRIKALSKGVDQAGYRTIIARLTAIMNLTKETQPKNHKIYKRDIKALQCKFRPKEHRKKCKT